MRSAESPRSKMFWKRSCIVPYECVVHGYPPRWSDDQADLWSAGEHRLLQGLEDIEHALLWAAMKRHQGRGVHRAIEDEDPSSGFTFDALEPGEVSGGDERGQ